MAKSKQELLERRRRYVRKRIEGTPERPRLRVNRSLKHIYAQIIDDVTGTTLVAESSVALKACGSNIEAAKAVGKALGEKAKAKSTGLSTPKASGSHSCVRIRSTTPARSARS